MAITHANLFSHGAPVLVVRGLQAFHIDFSEPAGHPFHVHPEEEVKRTRILLVREGEQLRPGRKVVLEVVEESLAAKQMDRYCDRNEQDPFLQLQRLLPLPS